MAKTEYNNKTKAIRVTEKNTELLALISNIEERTFKVNLGWVYVQDWETGACYHFILPEPIFTEFYRYLEILTTALDREDGD